MHADQTLVGRETERAGLDHALDEAVAGRPQLVVVEAEAGMGKSALLGEFIARRHTIGTVRWVQCAEFEQDLTFGIAGLLLEEDDDLSRFSRVEVGRRLLRWLGELQDHTEDAVVVAIDDAHWMDRASAEALRFALRRLRIDRVLCAVAGRAVPHSTAVRFAAIPSVGVVTTVLRPGPLEAAAVAELARRTRSWALSTTTAAQLVARTGGIPLLVAASVSGVSGPGLLESGAGVPASVAQATTGMLDSVDAPARRLIEATAVLGEPTELAVLAAIARVADPSAAATSAAASGLVRLDDQGRAHCAHALLQEALRGALPLTRRKELHARAAAWTTGGRRLAHRVAAADRPDHQLVADLVDAAAAARRAGNFAQAATHRLEARSVCDDPAHRDRLLLEALVERVEGHDLTGAQQLVPAAVDATAHHLRSRALGLLARERGEVGPARAWFREALNLATATDDAEATTRAALAAAVLHVRLGEGAAATELLASTEASDDPELNTDVLTTLSMGWWQSNQLGRAIRLLEDVPVSPDGTAWEAELVGARGMFYLYAGRLTDALEDLDTAIRWAHLWRPSTNQTRIYSLRSRTRYLLGDWDGASADATASRTLAHDSTDAWSAAYALGRSVDVPANRGRWDDASDYLAQARAALTAFAPDTLTDFVLVHEVALAVARNDHRAVVEALDPHWSQNCLERLSLLQASQETVQARIAALIGLGRLVEAEADLARYEAVLATTPDGPAPSRLDWLRGLLAEARGQPHQAREHYATELTDPRLEQTPFLLAHVLQSYGRLERLLGDRRAAIGHLTRAHDIFDRLKAAPFLARCRADLADCGVQSHGTTLLGMTPREQDVASLVARGYTNKEVGTELFLTAKTVEFHLGNIYTKLDITSRQQLRKLHRDASLVQVHRDAAARDDHRRAGERDR